MTTSTSDQAIKTAPEDDWRRHKTRRRGSESSWVREGSKRGRGVETQAAKAAFVARTPVAAGSPAPALAPTYP